ncbi:hypothetical protein RKLH11_3219 [Rhodobacteraceae bacterium KLH11]|nr:hypothetical protein RKLH11_3219 [Rhodobacteraceae bacterium KLH11]
MKHFNTIKNFIFAPALVIALTAGSALAGPGDNLRGKAHLRAQIGQSERSQDALQKLQQLPAVDYIGTIAFFAGEDLKFKQWQDNPTEIPIGTQFGVKKAAHAARFWASQND